MKIPAISKFPHGWVISGKVKPRPRAMLWLMAVFLSVIAACGQEPKEGIAFKAMAKEVAKLRKQVDALSAKPSSVHFRFQNLMPAMISDINNGFVSLVIFPEQARVGDWERLGPKYKKCRNSGEGGSAAVCPERAFHEMLLGPLITELVNCASSKKMVKLQVVAFASDSGITNWNNDWRKFVDERILSIDCPRRCTSDSCRSKKFNLMVANLRATNTAEMLRDFIRNRPIDVDAKQWNNHCQMLRERDRHGSEASGERSPNSGLMNRRAEIRIVTLPSCTFIKLPNGYDAGEDKQLGEIAQANVVLAKAVGQ